MSSEAVSGRGASLQGEPRGQLVRVWDPLVRSAHWILVAAFATAYLSEGEPLAVHVWAGYTVAAIVVLRVIWGFVGPERARFRDFVYSPSTVVAYLRDLVLMRGRRYLGHSPAGGAMTVILLLALAGTAGTGMVTLAQEEGSGPLSPWIARQVEPGAARAPAAGLAEEGDEGTRTSAKATSAFAEIHEVLANLALILVILHIGGVALASFAHRENLARAMVTGRKRGEA